MRRRLLVRGKSDLASTKSVQWQIQNKVREDRAVRKDLSTVSEAISRKDGGAC